MSSLSRHVRATHKRFDQSGDWVMYFLMRFERQLFGWVWDTV